jgi:hypothetical protein
MGLTSATFFISLLFVTLFLVHGKPIFSILTPIVFSLSGFFLSSFAFYSFGVLENIKIKLKALDEIYNGKALYREYIETRGEDR